MTPFFVFIFMEDSIVIGSLALLIRNTKNWISYNCECFFISSVSSYVSDVSMALILLYCLLHCFHVLVFCSEFWQSSPESSSFQIDDICIPRFKSYHLMQQCCWNHKVHFILQLINIEMGLLSNNNVMNNSGAVLPYILVNGYQLI